MVNIIIACDEKDATLGFFFAACQKHISDFFNSKAIVASQLKSDQLNDLAVSLHINDLTNFIFGAYSHGSKDSLLKSGSTEYVSIAKNGTAFNGGFVYTFSCSSGKELGRDLMRHECQCFIGYKNTVAIWSTLLVPFVECANHGLIEFINGIDTAEVMNSMIKKYNTEIDKIVDTDPIIASILLDNRRALIMHGNNISLASFN